MTSVLKFREYSNSSLKSLVLTGAHTSTHYCNPLFLSHHFLRVRVSGADVVKVERPGLGDELRTWGPPFAYPTDPDSDHIKESTYFMSINRNKRSITVNFKHEEGLQVVKDLVKDADIFLENFVPGKSILVIDTFCVGHFPFFGL